LIFYRLESPNEVARLGSMNTSMAMVSASSNGRIDFESYCRRVQSGFLLSAKVRPEREIVRQ